MISPPLVMDPAWLAPHLAYSIAKFGMSLCVLGLAQEFQKAGVAVNALWPRTIIGTAAIEFGTGPEGPKRMRHARRPEIMADAAHAIFTTRSRELTGRFLLDDSLLAERGVTDFRSYQVDPTVPAQIDMFIPADAPPPPAGVKLVGRGLSALEGFGH
jgi:citronellol/citronellal dehydrogenase